MTKTDEIDNKPMNWPPRCRDCGKPATRVFKPYVTHPRYNIYLCESHCDNKEWQRSHERYAPIRIAPYRQDGLPDTWEKEWTYLDKCPTGFVMVHPKALVY